LTALKFNARTVLYVSFFDISMHSHSIFNATVSLDCHLAAQGDDS